jgi:VWFA-related protein
MLFSAHVWPAILVSFLLVSGAAEPGNSGDSKDATYRSTVAEVRLRFVVTDDREQPITNLTQKDFAIVDDELVVRNFRSFRRADRSKLNIVVLADASESVAPCFRQELGDMLHLMEAETLSRNHASVVAVRGRQPQVICADDCARAAVAERLLATPSASSTPLFDGLALAADLLAPYQRPDSRSAVILFSDGEDTISRKSAGDAVESLLAVDAQLYAIDVKDAGGRPGGPRILQAMAAATGGRYIPSGAGARQILSAILEDLNTAFVVSYDVPRRTEGLHAVRIFPTRNPKLQFRCRRAYYYEAGEAH